jgi:predicted flavoprotein YhiN
VYALSPMLRDAIAADGHAILHLDLAPGRTHERLRDALSKPRAGRSLSEHLRRHAGIEGIKAGLLYEILGKTAGEDPVRLADAIKRLPIVLKQPRPLAEAISTAGGVRLDAMDEVLMLRADGDLPAGVFCAGEMLDWEAPTGGYLLTACFASGLRAGRGAADWLATHTPSA